MNTIRTMPAAPSVFRMRGLRGLGLGPTWSELANDLSYWWSTPAPDLTQLAAQQGNDQLQAQGINPVTLQPIAPQYAATIAANSGVNPSDSDAMKQYAAKVRKDAADQFGKDYQNSLDYQDANTKATWWKFAFIAGGIVAGGALAISAAKKVVN